MKKKSTKSILIILLCSIILILIYLGILLSFHHYTELTKDNEFGDYVGGVLNPLFTLLSTFSIIFLTYIIAKNDNNKAEKGIETQKRITLNQMRQESLKNLTDKLNMFGYQLNELSILQGEPGTFVQKVLTKNKEKEEKEEVFLWIIILIELENFSDLKYLFAKLLENKDFIENYELIKEATNKLSEEQKEMKMITISSFSNFIEAKQKFVMKIGDFIISEF